MDRKAHWEKLYSSKTLQEVSWYQPNPLHSLEFIRELGISTDAAILDVGGGDSLLADCLLDRGYTDITVLDISSAAIERAKKRLGSRSELVQWIVTDITQFKPTRQYDCWHDRATFHFLTNENEVDQYLSIAQSALADTGRIIIGTFSETGPDKCSGLPVQQYSESGLTKRIRQWFNKIKCLHADHITPSGILQNFLFCSFKKQTLNHGHT